MSQQPISASQIGAPVWDVEVIKLATESRINTITVVDDSELILPCEANTIYEIEGLVQYNTDASSPDITYGVAYSGAYNGGGSVNFSFTGAGTSTVRIGGIGGTVDDTSATSTFLNVNFRGMFTADTAGDFTFKWAQRILDAVNNTNVYAGSYIRARKMLVTDGGSPLIWTLP